MRSNPIFFSVLLWLIPMCLVLTSCEQQDANSISPAATSFASVAVTSASTSFEPASDAGLIAFVSDRRKKDNLDIWVIDAAGEILEAITSTDSQDWHPLWSPDGRKLAYLSADNSEDVYLVVVESDTWAEYSRLYTPDIWSFSWSSDSSAIWLDTYEGVWQYNLLSDEVTKVFDTVRPFSESKNGDLLAMGAQRADRGVVRELIVQDLVGSLFPVSFSRADLDSLIPNYLDWANTSSQLVVSFQPITRQSAGGISILSLNGDTFEETETLTGQEPSSDFCRPTWSPKSDLYILYVEAWSYSEVPCLGSVFVTSNNFEQITRISDNATITRQAWSPSGDWIVFAKNAKSPWWAPSRSFGFPGEGSLWISNFDGSESKLLSDEEWYDGEAVWQPLVSP
jgi:Tol biopolymer transport system component